MSKVYSPQKEITPESEPKRVDAAALQSELQSLESMRRTAMVDANVETLNTLLDDAVTYVHSNGVVETKSEYLELIRRKVYDYTEVLQPEMNVRILGDVALVTGRMILRVRLSDGDTKTVNGRSIVVWGRISGQWRMQLYQGTALPP